MNPQQAENLRILIRHMEGACTRTLNMGFIDKSCGTPGCAMGEALTVPALRMLGLERTSVSREMWNHLYNDGNPGPIFGLQQSAASRLFGTSILNAWKRDNVTPQQWAAEARKVLAENGYTMDDGFAAFKAKILAPLATAIA